MLNRTLLTAYTLLLTAVGLFAQPEKPSPYSSSEAPDTEMDPYGGAILWVGLLLIGVAIIYIVVKGRKA